MRAIACAILCFACVYECYSLRGLKKEGVFAAVIALLFFILTIIFIILGV